MNTRGRFADAGLVAQLGVELTVEERNLLSVSYKNVIGARRASWRIISSIEQKEESKGNDSQVAKIKAYRQKVEAELSDVCNDILSVLDDHLIPAAQAGESKVRLPPRTTSHRGFALRPTQGLTRAPAPRRSSTTR